MKIIKNDIKDLYIIEPTFFSDKRGFFVKTFHESVLSSLGLECRFRESFYTVSKMNVIRGMHFQVPPYDSAKLALVMSGSIVDVILDIRRSSPTYKKFISIELSAENKKTVYIPKGCAHGFVSREDNSCIFYLHTSVYVQSCDKGIRYDSFGMNWNVENPIVSDRDAALPMLDEFETPFC